MTIRADTWRSFPWVERGLTAIGVACLAWVCMNGLHVTRYQRERRAILERVRAGVWPAGGARATMATGGLIGSLDIPRLGLSAMVVEGDDGSTLNVAVGHLPDTPLPWEDGNTSLAGHRDTFFRSLEDIRVGDVVHLTTAYGTFRYSVRQMMIVGPGDVWVLSAQRRPTLTLITCHPFNYMGRAPRRFVVRAERATLS